MPARHLRVQVVIPAANHVPADAVTNTFHLLDDGTDNAGAPAAAAAQVADFYTHAVAAAFGVPEEPALGTFLGDDVARDIPTLVKVYLQNAPGTPSGPPILTGSFTMPTSTDGTNVPRQVAACLSFHADLSGIPEGGGAETIPTTEEARDQGAPGTYATISRSAARLRGRIYIGPLCQAGIDTEGHVSGALRTKAVSAASRLIGQSSAAHVPWEVWSTRTGTGHIVTGGFMDNRPDTVRRRLIKANTRSTFIG